MSGASLAIDIDRDSSGSRATRGDEVAVEEPLEIQLCAPEATGAAAKSISITMRTPGHDVELALGFLFGESIIERATDVQSAESVGSPDPQTGLKNTVRVELRAGVAVDLDRLERHFYTTSSCGVCGKASIDALRVEAGNPVGDFGMERNALTALPGLLRKQQHLFDTTGGLHGAAAFDRDGNLTVVREDVGRHNAVDKVIGRLLADGRIPAPGLGMLVSGRASFELLQKTLVAGMPMLAAVGAPSSLAVRLAREFGLTLVGFLREEQFNIYSGSERIGS